MLRAGVGPPRCAVGVDGDPPRRADTEPTATQGDHPADQHQVGEQQEPADVEHSADQRRHGRLLCLGKAVTGADAVHGIHHDQLVGLQAVVVDRAAHDGGQPDDRARRGDQQCACHHPSRCAQGGPESPLRQGQCPQHGKREQRHQERGFAPPTGERLLRSVDGSDRAAQRCHPEPVGVGHHRREGDDGAPRDTQLTPLTGARGDRGDRLPGIDRFHGIVRHRIDRHRIDRHRGSEGPRRTLGHVFPAHSFSQQQLADRPTAYGVISQPNIMAWSSCARLWQCAT